MQRYKKYTEFANICGILLGNSLIFDNFGGFWTKGKRENKTNRCAGHTDFVVEEIELTTAITA